MTAEVRKRFHPWKRKIDFQKLRKEKKTVNDCKQLPKNEINFHIIVKRVKLYFRVLQNETIFKTICVIEIIAIAGMEFYSIIWPKLVEN